MTLAACDSATSETNSGSPDVPNSCNNGQCEDGLVSHDNNIPTGFCGDGICGLQKDKEDYGSAYVGCISWCSEEGGCDDYITEDCECCPEDCGCASDEKCYGASMQGVIVDDYCAFILDDDCEEKEKKAQNLHKRYFCETDPLIDYYWLEGQWKRESVNGFPNGKIVDVTVEAWDTEFGAEVHGFLPLNVSYVKKDVEINAFNFFSPKEEDGSYAEGEINQNTLTLEFEYYNIPVGKIYYSIYIKL
jgi:hypothetical protein